MQKHSVLVLGAKQHEVLVKTLISIGAKLVLSPTLQEALNHLRHERYLAVILDYQTLQENNHVIEFAVKIRDTNKSIPILIIAQQGIDPEHQKTLLNLGHIHLIIEGGGIQKLSPDASYRNRERET